MKLVHPGDPSFTGDPPGFLNPLVKGDAGSNTSLGPVRDLSSFQCQNRLRSSASSRQNVSSSITAPASQSRARIVMKGDKVRSIEEVPFVSVHNLGARIVALIAEDASTAMQPDRRSVVPLGSTSSPAAAAGDANEPANRNEVLPVNSTRLPVASGSGQLATLKTIEPGGINVVAEDEWVEIEVAVDSGATEAVMSEDTPKWSYRHYRKCCLQTWYSLRSRGRRPNPKFGRTKVLGDNGRWVGEGSGRTDLCSQQNVDERQQDREQRQQSCF